MLFQRISLHSMQWVVPKIKPWSYEKRWNEMKRKEEKKINKRKQKSIVQFTCLCIGCSASWPTITKWNRKIFSEYFCWWVLVALCMSTYWIANILYTYIYKTPHRGIANICVRIHLSPHIRTMHRMKHMLGRFLIIAKRDLVHHTNVYSKHSDSSCTSSKCTLLFFNFSFRR